MRSSIVVRCIYKQYVTYLYGMNITGQKTLKYHANDMVIDQLATGYKINTTILLALVLMRTVHGTGNI